MRFERSSQYHLRSDCKRYTIAKVIVFDQVQYEAWHKAEGKPAALIAGKLTDSTAAIEACRIHQQASGKAA